MYISENRIKNVAAYGVVTIFCAVFTIIYYRFSHEIYSPYLTWMWCVPFAAGALGAVMNILRKNRPVHAAALCLYNSGTAALVVYMALRGILKIAGATSSYAIIIGVAGAVMIAAGTVMKMLIIKK